MGVESGRQRLRPARSPVPGLLDRELQKVRKTVDYLHAKSPNVIAVINTTGTPYYQRQLLRDVVVWYGLFECTSTNTSTSSMSCVTSVRLTAQPERRRKPLAEWTAKTSNAVLVSALPSITAAQLGP